MPGEKPRKRKVSLYTPYEQKVNTLNLTFPPILPFFFSFFMALLNHTALTFPVIVQGKKVAISCVGLGVVDGQRLKRDGTPPPTSARDASLCVAAPDIEAGSSWTRTGSLRLGGSWLIRPYLHTVNGLANPSMGS
jgi:hypothetical protein